ncbi:inositol phosphorylceramide synthase [Nocardioides sp. zg-579]|uniref:Inositol phosphorylceramide synthase n=1 Tax=Nocardioides marmotae TaxID=2663857 RepID=A0A6I3IWK9_9ACTN|nr:phosphatase PAP2 family protein [Nocardioides marmotae]MCR6031124.1 inositol phosphorylceramide synthase [Gordonia jinghuaiqii]MTB94763.1 inositol phosphorylceramide synthase [Nocardioides marmotae]
MTTTARPARPPAPRVAGRAAAELALVSVLFGIYTLGRALVDDGELVAFRNARWVREVQDLLGLPSEAALQAAVHALAHGEALLRVANVYYTGVHFPLMVVFLVWGFLWRPVAEYRWARNLVVLQTGAALVVHVAFPLAPPRMFPEWGFVDTMTRYGPSPYDGAGGALANQLAAMPSLHVGWAVLIAYVVVRTGPRPLGVLAVGHAVLTTAIVVVTANHWWLDALAGVLLLVAAAAVLRRSGPGGTGSGGSGPVGAGVER